jgi:hypothetical protein
MIEDKKHSLDFSRLIGVNLRKTQWHQSSLLLVKAYINTQHWSVDDSVG